MILQVLMCFFVIDLSLGEAGFNLYILTDRPFQYLRRKSEDFRPQQKPDELNDPNSGCLILGDDSYLTAMKKIGGFGALESGSPTQSTNFYH